MGINVKVVFCDFCSCVQLLSAFELHFVNKEFFYFLFCGLRQNIACKPRYIFLNKCWYFPDISLWHVFIIFTWSWIIYLIYIKLACLKTRWYGFKPSSSVTLCLWARNFSTVYHGLIKWPVQIYQLWQMWIGARTGFPACFPRYFLFLPQLLG